MCQDSTDRGRPESESLFDRIDKISDSFESAWRAGKEPRIEDYLDGVPEAARGELLRELLPLELSWRRNQPRQPEPSEFFARFPEYRGQIETAFAKAARATEVRGGSTFGVVGDEALAVRSEGGTRRRRTSFGHFDLIEQLGAGAFGTVWRARDRQLDRTVAVKIPRKGQLSREETEKFLREARTAAQLRHPNIVSVHEVGLEGELVYTVADFIKGLSLHDWLTGQRLAHREAAELCAKLAEAIHFAHEQGVIHRDLKPSNVLMDGSGEPHITDFGFWR